MLVRIELYKLFTRGRTFIGFVAILVIVVIFQLALYYEGKEMIDFVTSNLSDVFVMQGNLMNSYLVSYFIINALWVHVPILVVLVTGDLISGESQSGTIRLILSRPVSRISFVTAKMIVAVIYSSLLVILLAFLSLTMGYFLFGTGDLMVILGTVNIIAEHDALWRFIGAFSFGVISMMMIAALSVFFSALSNNSLAPILITMALIIVLSLIVSLDLSALNTIKPFLFTNYLTSWQLFFDYEVDVNRIIHHGIILFVFILIFYILTVVVFRRKDILI
jgi:ABC-2 type transport system permease protein